MVTRPRQLACAVLLLAATTGAVGVVAATGASAASCSAVTISAGRNLTLNVSNVFVTEGGCVRFANLTDVTVAIRVSGSSFSERLPARTPASASRSFTATKSARVTATDGVRTGHGTITVSSATSTPAATPTSTPRRSTVVVPPKSTNPTPTTKPSKSSSSHGSDLPSAVSTDAAAAVNTQHPFALPALPAVPPVQGGGDSGSSRPPTVSHPVVAPRVKSSDPRLTSTVLEPAGGPRRGLPATVAAVLLLGLAAAYGRTVLVAGSAVERRPAPRAVRRTV